MLMDLINGVIDEREYLAINNVAIVYDKLPKYTYGCIKKIKGINLICIKSSLSDDKKKETILHEFAHLELNHLYKYEMSTELCVDNIEDEVDEYIRQITKID